MGTINAGLQYDNKVVTVQTTSGRGYVGLHWRGPWRKVVDPQPQLNATWRTRGVVRGTGLWNPSPPPTHLQKPPHGTMA